MNNYSIVVITHNKDLAIPVQESLKPLPSEVFYAPNYPSFSKVVNEAIVSTKTEIVIIASYKVRPKPHDIERLLSLLEEGYGFVGLYRYGFFGFRKDLIRKIGFFDERYIKGGFEDCDFLRRVIEANIAHYDDESVEYISAPSTWGNSSSINQRAIFNNKWTENSQTNTIHRKLPEEVYTYDLGPNPNTEVEPQIYLGREKSYSCYPSTQLFCRTIQFI